MPEKVNQLFWVPGTRKSEDQDEATLVSGNALLSYSLNISNQVETHPPKEPQ